VHFSTENCCIVVISLSEHYYVIIDVDNNRYQPYVMFVLGPTVPNTVQGFCLSKCGVFLGIVFPETDSGQVDRLP
jgi:hypothetical protein